MGRVQRGVAEPGGHAGSGRHVAEDRGQSAGVEDVSVLRQRVRLARDGQDAAQALRNAITQASQIAMDFPRLRARVEAATVAGYGEAPDNGFDYGLKDDP